MKGMGAPEGKTLAQESVSEQASSELSGKRIALITLVSVIAVVLTAFAVINNFGQSTISDNPNPMASGEFQNGGDSFMPEIAYPDIEENVGDQWVYYYASEGGTLTYDPDDDASVGNKPISGDSNQIQMISGPNARTGLKQYSAKIAVNPMACFGSVTAVPDDGFVFAGWSNGNNSSKTYIWGAMSGSLTAYFEPVAIEAVSFEEPSMDGSQEVRYNASDGGTLTYAPNDYDPAFDELGQPRPDAKLNVQTGLKHYKKSVAVTPYAFYGSITAVPDPGYIFTGWSNGSESPKTYINGFSNGTITAYFEEIPTVSISDKPQDVGGSQEVEYLTTEGGTLTYDPDDYDPNDDWDKPQPSSGSNIQTGLKKYKRNVAVTPYARYGSITAVPDPGYVFVGWNNGENQSSKIYIKGLMHGTATAYFEKLYEVVNVPEPDVNGSTGSLPTMTVYAQNALDGTLVLEQGKSLSLHGFAVLTGIDYAGSVTGKVDYKSSNANVATVNGSGKVVANSKKIGTAKITISSTDNPNCKKVISVKVLKKTKYKAPKKIMTINLKKQYKADANKQIAVKILKWNPKSPSNKNFAVSVSPTSKASVDPITNKITFKAKGTVKVIVKSTVDPKVKKIVKVKVK